MANLNLGLDYGRPRPLELRLLPKLRDDPEREAPELMLGELPREGLELKLRELEPRDGLELKLRLGDGLGLELKLRLDVLPDEREPKLRFGEGLGLGAMLRVVVRDGLLLNDRGDGVRLEELLLKLRSGVDDRDGLTDRGAGLGVRDGV